MAVQIISKTVNRTKREISERVLGKALGLLGNNPEKNAKYVVKAIDHFMGRDEKGLSSGIGLMTGSVRANRGASGWAGFSKTLTPTCADAS